MIADARRIWHNGEVGGIHRLQPEIRPMRNSILVRAVLVVLGCLYAVWTGYLVSKAGAANCISGLGKCGSTDGPCMPHLRSPCGLEPTPSPAPPPDDTSGEEWCVGLCPNIPPGYKMPVCGGDNGPPMCVGLSALVFIAVPVESRDHQRKAARATVACRLRCASVPVAEARQDHLHPNRPVGNPIGVFREA